MNSSPLPARPHTRTPESRIKVAWILLVFILVACASCVSRDHATLNRITVASSRAGFIFSQSKKPFTPWGVNYGHAGKLIEDFWETDWRIVEDDFVKMKSLGVNVVRVHLQFGKFMRAPEEPNARALRQLRKLLRLAERTGLYLDLTGLACYRTSDVPKWYDTLDESGRWNAQANFWRAIAREGRSSSAIFCYDLINEPIVPGDKRTNWYSGTLLGGLDFIQFITRDPTGRPRHEIATAWIDKMSAAVRAEDPRGLITVGMLPWVTGWKHFSGFVPKEVAPHVDFISVHIYPKTKQPDEAFTALRECAVGKPVLIEETFPLECNVAELEAFLRASRSVACGWVSHYDGFTTAEYDAMARTNTLTVPQGIWRDALKSFERMRAEFAPAEERLHPFFNPPPEFANQLGQYRLPLIFRDGSLVTNAAQWPARRKEILREWTDLMGEWPPMIKEPKLEILSTTNREAFTQQRVRLETAPGQFGEGWLLVPPGEGPFPAVLVVFYEPETSIGLKTNSTHRDFALQLTRRGFVTLSIGTPGGNAWKPDVGKAVCQPLSFHAYVAANAWNALASLPTVDSKRIGVVGHSYGGKWAMFAGALWDKFAAVAVSDPGIVFDESRSNVNYWEPWYLGLDFAATRKPGIPSPQNPRTGAYREMIARGYDLHEIHALIAPRPFLVSGGAEDPASRWTALNHLVAVNHLLGYTNRVAMTTRPKHDPNDESNAVLLAFFEHFLRAR
jgi:dienelactone hydrolase